MDKIKFTTWLGVFIVCAAAWTGLFKAAQIILA